MTKLRSKVAGCKWAVRFPIPSQKCKTRFAGEIRKPQPQANQVACEGLGIRKRSALSGLIKSEDTLTEPNRKTRPNTRKQHAELKPSQKKPKPNSNTRPKTETVEAAASLRSEPAAPVWSSPRTPSPSSPRTPAPGASNRDPDALYTDRTLQLANGGVQLYFGVKKQHVTQMVAKWEFFSGALFEPNANDAPRAGVVRSIPRRICFASAPREFGGECGDVCWRMWLWVKIGGTLSEPQHRWHMGLHPPQNPGIACDPWPWICSFRRIQTPGLRANPSFQPPFFGFFPRTSATQKSVSLHPRSQKQMAVSLSLSMHPRKNEKLPLEKGKRSRRTHQRREGRCSRILKIAFAGRFPFYQDPNWGGLVA